MLEGSSFLSQGKQRAHSQLCATLIHPVPAGLQSQVLQKDHFALSFPGGSIFPSAVCHLVALLHRNYRTHSHKNWWEMRDGPKKVDVELVTWGKQELLLMSFCSDVRTSSTVSLVLSSH